MTARRPALRSSGKPRTVAEWYGAHELQGTTAPPRSFVEAVRRLTREVLVDELDDEDDERAPWRQVALPDPCPGAEPRYVTVRGARPDMVGLHLAAHDSGRRNR